MRLRPAVFSLVLLAAPAAQAARPFVTDDARIVDKGGCQIETFVKRQRRVDETEFWFMPACNSWGAELTAGHIRVDSTPNGDTRTTLLQAKMMLRPLTTNGAGFALTLGTLLGRTSNPYFNAIGSLSIANDRVVLHGNLGGIRDNLAHVSRGTWGAGAEILLIAPRLYGIVESYGQRGEKPT
ncbi:MAG TPA: hypothetical protein VGQ19_08745, partial [Burkholderiales bacterium]|nr:hypothetical protein [Burkholderiales bacterium]